MNLCHQGCGAQCRACESAAAVAKAANGAALSEKDLADMLLIGHAMAIVSVMQKTAPIGRLHLCQAHADFMLATAASMGVHLSIGHTINMTTAPSKAVN